MTPQRKVAPARTEATQIRKAPVMPETTLARRFLGTALLERRVRSKDPATSWHAAVIDGAESIKVREWVELFLTRAPGSTDDEIFAAYKRSGGRRTAQRVRTARAELSNPVTGEPRVTPVGVGVSANGSPAQKWAVA